MTYTNAECTVENSCPKHVEFLDKNKFGEISASVCFVKKKYTIGVTLIPALDTVISTIQVKVKFIPQQSTKTQSGSRDTALLFVYPRH